VLILSGQIPEKLVNREVCGTPKLQAKLKFLKGVNNYLTAKEGDL
jgi:hypothetical protein